MRQSLKLLIMVCATLQPWSVFPAEEPSAQNSPSAPTLQRKISFRAYEVYQQRKLRIHLAVFESDGGARYPLNTLDGKSFRFIPEGENEIPLEPSSLSTFATRSPLASRETAIVFEAHQSLSQPYFDAIRAGVAGFLGGFRSEILSVRASTSSKEIRLAWSVPGQSENPRAVQKSILESARVEGVPGVAAGLCAAVKELNPNDDAQSVIQKNLIFISGAAGEGDSGWSEGKRCLSKAVDVGSRIFWLRLHDQNVESGKADLQIEGLVEKSGGFVSQIGVSSDPMAAMNNLRSYLDDEYVIEFDLSQLRPYSDAIKAVLSANYHGNILRSEPITFEGLFAVLRPEELERIENLREAARKKDRQNYIYIASVLTLAGMVIIYLLRRNTAGCKKCGFRVSSSFQDCPFRNAKCQGRLSVVQGEGLGSEFPLFAGANTLGSASNSTIRLKHKSISRNHGQIQITKRKALFSPVKGSETRVNGVIATEPRLLSSGTILKIGELVCRVDFKEGA